MTKANELTEKLSENLIELCSIANVRSGKCSENCSFCAQSAHFDTNADEYDLLDKAKVLEYAKKMESQKVKRFSLVSSGKGLNPELLEKLLPIYKALKEETSLSICASHGLLSKDMAKKLKEAGVNRYHHNLEAGPNYFHKICTTHKYQDRIDTIKNAKEAGMDICVGGIMGLGETPLDRIEMALDIKDLDVDSIPLNVLTPIEGTPLGKEEILTTDEILRTIAIYRIINPDTPIRFAGGRTLLELNEQLDTYKAGINAIMVGDYLTTDGFDIGKDLSHLKDNKFKIL